MKKVCNTIIVLLILFSVFGCSVNTQNNEQINEESPVEETPLVEETPITEETEEVIEIVDDLNDYKTAPFKAICNATIYVRYGPSTDTYVKGYVRKGDYFEVYETVEKEGYIWNRIGTNAWIANDGTWLVRVPYSTDFNAVIADPIMLKELPKRIEGTYFEDGGGTIYSKGNEILTVTKSSDGYITYIERNRKGEDHGIDQNGSEVVNQADRTEEIGWPIVFGISPVIYQKTLYSEAITLQSDENDKLIHQYSNSGLNYSYSYNELGQLVEIVSQLGSRFNTMTYTFIYEKGKLIKTSRSVNSSPEDEVFDGTVENHDIEYNGNLIFSVPTESTGFILDVTDTLLRVDDKGRIIEEYKVFMGNHDWFYYYD